MGNSGTAFYAALAEQLSRRATRAVVGLRGLRSDALRAYLAARLDQAPGTEGALLADPVFEATFGWQLSTKTLDALSGGLLCDSLVRALRILALESFLRSDAYLRHVHMHVQT